MSEDEKVRGYATRDEPKRGIRPIPREKFDDSPRPPRPAQVSLFRTRSPGAAPVCRYAGTNRDSTVTRSGSYLQSSPPSGFRGELASREGRESQGGTPAALAFFGALLAVSWHSNTGEGSSEGCDGSNLLSDAKTRLERRPGPGDLPASQTARASPEREIRDIFPLSRFILSHS